MAAIIPPRPVDTSVEAERVQIDLIRAAPVSRRLHMAWSLSATVIGLARQALARAQPDASTQEIDLRFVELHYGLDLAAARARLYAIGERTDSQFFVASAEDTVLAKLEWFRRGGETSERQWWDIVGVLKAVLGVGDLIERALMDAGTGDPLARPTP